MFDCWDEFFRLHSKILLVFTLQKLEGSNKMAGMSDYPYYNAKIVDN